MGYKAIIIEDNPVDAEILQDYLNKYFPEISIVAHGCNVQDIIKLATEHSPDILFMDIELENGNSVEALDSLNTENIQLIFITSHDVFAIAAIRANAVDYIVKPVDAILLKKAVFKTLQRIEKKRNLSIALNPSIQKVSISTPDGYIFLDADKIIRIEARGGYSFFIATEQDPLVSSKTLTHCEKDLPENLFMRVHDSCIVNRQFIAEYIRGKHGRIRMDDGFVCNISDNKRDIFLNWMQAR